MTSKKNFNDIFNMPYTLLGELRYGGGENLSTLVDRLYIPAQNLRYWLKKLCDEGLVSQPGRGWYELTFSGKKIHDQYENFRNKQLIRIENMHVTYEVLEEVKNLLEKYPWKKSKLRNGVKQYITYMKGHTIKLIVGKSKQPQLTVIVTKVLDVNIANAYASAIVEAEKVTVDIVNFAKTPLSEPRISGKPEIAIPCPVSSALLDMTGASQIRTNKGIMNRSKGRGADWETTDLQRAQRIVDMPDTLDTIFQRVAGIENMLIEKSRQNSFQGIQNNLSSIVVSNTITNLIGFSIRFLSNSKHSLLEK